MTEPRPPPPSTNTTLLAFFRSGCRSPATFIGMLYQCFFFAATSFALWAWLANVIMNHVQTGQPPPEGLGLLFWQMAYNIWIGSLMPGAIDLLNAVVNVTKAGGSYLVWPLIAAYIIGLVQTLRPRRPRLPPPPVRPGSVPAVPDQPTV
jgi:hypothetical protein